MLKRLGVGCADVVDRGLGRDCEQTHEADRVGSLAGFVE